MKLPERAGRKGSDPASLRTEGATASRRPYAPSRWPRVEVARGGPEGDAEPPGGSPTPTPAHTAPSHRPETPHGLHCWPTPPGSPPRIPPPPPPPPPTPTELPPSPSAHRNPHPPGRPPARRLDPPIPSPPLRSFRSPRVRTGPDAGRRRMRGGHRGSRRTAGRGDDVGAVGGDDDRGANVAGLAGEFRRGPRGSGIEADEGLVGEEDGEGADEGEGDRGLLLHPLRGFCAGRVLPALEAEAADQLGDPRPSDRRLRAGRRRFGVLDHAEVFVEDR